jgi:site-specific DNA-methyltransferase (cytosine-N4-specific)
MGAGIPAIAIARAAGDSCRCVASRHVAPYALHFKKEFGNVDKNGYVAWLLPFGCEIRRELKEDGSFDEHWGEF